MNVWKIALALVGAGLILAAALTHANAGLVQHTTVHPILGLAPAHTFVVTKTSDNGNNNSPGAGTLRKAILDANKSPGFDLIVFDLPGSGVVTFTVNQYLPDLNDDAGTMIDGTQGDDTIEIDGSGIYNHHGIALNSNNNVIKGLIINGVQGGGAGIGILSGSTGNVIIGNRIGTNVAGNSAKGNHSGVYIAPGSNGNYIGGTDGVTPSGACNGDCNVLSGNRFHGVVVDRASKNVIVGNFIGVNANGTAAVANGEDGVLLGNAAGNTIGGDSDAERNVISGNRVINIEVGAAGSQNNTVRGNYIGLNSSGNGVVSNPGTGIMVDVDARDNVIDRNVVGGNTANGITVFKSATRTTITNNRVGIGPNGNNNFGNGDKGIELQANNNTIIGNRVGFSGLDGIRVKTGTNNEISQNETFQNGKFGINLGSDGLSKNDSGDGDSGPNQLQNFPNISSATFNNGEVTVSGNLNSRANGRYTLEFFYNGVCDVTFGNPVGEGERYLGSTVVTTNGSGNAGFSQSFQGMPGSGVITATATDSNNNTSEYSYCRTIVSGVAKPPQPNLLSPSNGESVTQNPPRFAWTASSGADRYMIIIRADSADGPKVHVNKNIQGTEYTPPALPTGRILYWLIKACNSAGCSKSGKWTVTIQ